MVKKAYQNPEGGLNAAGRKHLNKTEGSKLKPPVPAPKTPVDKARKDSFCARMGGMPGPMTKPDGKPTRKALSLSKWAC